jgi:hypothetical protein
MRLYSISLVLTTALTLLGLDGWHAAAQTFKAKFGTGTWTAYGSVRSPTDDLWTPGEGPNGEFWISPGGVWRPTPGSPVRNPRADTWTLVPSGSARTGSREVGGRTASRPIANVTSTPARAFRDWAADHAAAFRV